MCAVITHDSPDVEVHEGGEADDGVGDALDGVVVEQQPLHAAVAHALRWNLQQLVARQIWEDRSN